MAIAALPTKVARVSSPLAQAPRSTNTSQDASETLHTRPTQSLGVQQVLSAGLRQFVGHGPLYATTYLPDIPANVTIRVEHSTVDDAAPEAAELLAHLRSQTGLPVEVLAGALGVSRQTFYNWLYGETPSATNETRIRALANLVANRLEGDKAALPSDISWVATRVPSLPAWTRSRILWPLPQESPRLTSRSNIRVTAWNSPCRPARMARLPGIATKIRKPIRSHRTGEAGARRSNSNNSGPPCAGRRPQAHAACMDI